jgi:hypothetical protein
MYGRDSSCLEAPACHLQAAVGSFPNSPCAIFHSCPMPSCPKGMPFFQTEHLEHIYLPAWCQLLGALRLRLVTTHPSARVSSLLPSLTCCELWCIAIKFLAWLLLGIWSGYKDNSIQIILWAIWFENLIGQRESKILVNVSLSRSRSSLQWWHGHRFAIHQASLAPSFSCSSPQQ